MILVHFHLADDTEIARVWMRSSPAVGELLWFPGATYTELTQRYGTTSFLIEEVAHWICPGWDPATHVGEPIHSICAYVKPMTAGRSSKA